MNFSLFSLKTVKVLLLIILIIINACLLVYLFFQIEEFLSLKKERENLIEEIKSINDRFTLMELKISTIHHKLEGHIYKNSIAWTVGIFLFIMSFTYVISYTVTPELFVDNLNILTHKCSQLSKNYYEQLLNNTESQYNANFRLMGQISNRLTALETNMNTGFRQMSWEIITNSERFRSNLASRPNARSLEDLSITNISFS